MNEADLAAMPEEVETQSTAQSPELLPFNDWVDKNRPPEDDPLGKFRGYSGYVRQSLLEQGRWSDTLVSKIDERLAGLAVESGAYTPQEGRETLVGDVLAPPPEAALPAEDLLDYSHSIEPGEAGPRRTAAAKFIALRDGGQSIALNPEDYANRMAAAEAEIRTAFTPEDMLAARKESVKSGKSLAALVRTPEGYDDVEVSDTLLEYVNGDGTLDDKGLALALKMKGTDPMLIPSIRAKLSTPDGYTKPLSVIQKSSENRASLDALATARDGVTGFRFDETVQKIAAGIERGEDPSSWNWIDDTAMFEAKRRVRGTPLADLPDVELRTQLIDLAKSRLNPEIDPEDPAKSIQKLSTGEVVIPPAVMLNDGYFEKAVTDPSVPLAQRDGLRRNRELFAEAAAFPVTTILANDPQGGEAFIAYQEAELAKGKKQSEIVRGWISQGNFSATELYARGIGRSIPEAVRSLVFALPAMAGNEYSLEVLRADQQADASRRAYAEQFGFKPGIGYDLGRLVAPVAVDLLVSKGVAVGATAAAKATAGGAVKSFIRNAVNAETKGLVQSWARGAASSQAVKLGAAKGVQLTAPEVIALAGRDVATKFSSGVANTAFAATAYSRSAGSTYASLSGALSQETNPDGSAKYTPEEVKEIAFAHANASGLFTVATTMLFQAAGRGGMESILNSKLTNTQLRKVASRLGKDVAGITDDVTVQKFLHETYRKTVSPFLSGAKDEAAEEFIQSGFDHINEKLATGEPINIPALFKEAGYGALLGGIMGGTVSKVGDTMQSRQEVDPNTEADIRRTRLLEVATKLQETSPKTAQVLRNYAFNQRSAVPQIRAKEAELAKATTPEAKEAITAEIQDLNAQAQADPLAALNEPDTTEENIPEAPAEGGTEQEAGDEGMAPRRRVEARSLTTPAGARMRTRESLIAEIEAEISPEDAVSPIGEIEQEPAQTAPETPEVGEVPLTEDTRSAERRLTGREAASWVIRDKNTREVVMETFDRKKVDALNTEKYEAVPIGEYLSSLNETPSPTAPTGTLPEGQTAPTGKGAVTQPELPNTAVPRKRNLSTYRDKLIDRLDAAERAAEPDPMKIERLTSLLAATTNMMLESRKELAARPLSADPAAIVEVAEAENVTMAEAVKPEKPLTRFDEIIGEEVITEAGHEELDRRKSESGVRDTREPGQQTPVEFERVYGKGYAGQIARDIANNPQALAKRLREGLSHERVKNGQNWKLDMERLQLVSPDGSRAVRYKIRRIPGQPESYENQQNSTGTYDFVQPDSPLKGDELGVKPDIQERHEALIFRDLQRQDPVSAEAVDTYGVKLPDGYIKQGDLYVYQPETPITDIITEVPADYPVTPEAAKLVAAATVHPGGLANALHANPAAREAAAALLAAKGVAAYKESGVKRDGANYRAQKTPSEFLENWSYENALVRASKDHTGKETKELKKLGKEGYDTKVGEMLKADHIREIEMSAGMDTETNQSLSEALGRDTIIREPVSAEAVDTYGIKLPEGYVKQGDLYVAKPEPLDATALAYLGNDEIMADPVIAGLAGRKIQNETNERTNINANIRQDPDVSETEKLGVGDERLPRRGEKTGELGRPAGTENASPVSDRAASGRSDNESLQSLGGRGAGKSGNVGGLKADTVIAGLAGTDVRGTRVKVSRDPQGITVLKRRGFNPDAKRKTKSSKPITVEDISFSGNTITIPPVYSDVTSREVIMLDTNGNETSIDFRSLRGAAGFAESQGQNTSLAGGRQVDVPAGVQTIVVIDTNPKLGNLAGPDFAKIWSRASEAITEIDTKPLKSTTPANSVQSELNAFGISDGIPAFLANVAKRGGKNYAPIAKLLLDAGAGNVEVRIVNLPNTDAAGFYVGANGVVHINTARNGPRGAVDTVLHELLHAVTEGSLKNPTPAQEKVIAKISRVRATVIKRAKAQGTYSGELEYALGSNSEFLTHFFTSPEFRDRVAAMTPKAERNWVQVIADMIADLVHGRLRTKAERLSDSLRKDLVTLIQSPTKGLNSGDMIRNLPATRTPAPDFKAAEDKFNNQVNEYVTGEWPADSAGRYDALMSFAGQWAATYTGVSVRVADAREASSSVDVNTGGDAVAQFGGETATALSERTGGGIPFTIIPDTGTTSRLRLSETNTPEIEIRGGNAFRTSQVTGITEAEAKRLIASEVNEEVIHYLHFEEVRKRMGADTTDAEVAQEIRATYLEMFNHPDAEVREAFVRYAYESYITYTKQEPDAETSENPEPLMRYLMLDNPEYPLVAYLAAYEAVRQIVQVRTFGTATEARFVTFGERVIQWFQDRLAAIRNFASRTEVLGERMERDVLETERALNELRGIRLQPATARDVARFNQLTEPLYQGRDSATAAEIAAFREANPDTWAELSRMREDVLREMGYDVEAWHGSPDFKGEAFDRKFFGRNTGLSRGGFSFTTDRDSATAYMQGEVDQSQAMVDAANDVMRELQKLIDGGLEWAGPFGEDFAPEFRSDNVDDMDDVADYMREIAKTLPENMAQRLLEASKIRETSSSPRLIHVFLKNPSRMDVSGKQLLQVTNPADAKSADPLTAGTKVTPDQWADAGSSDIRFQPSTTPSTPSDTKYLAAVEAGDMETAQKMVDNAAKAAGYDTNETFIHHTFEKFTTFMPGGKTPQLSGRGIWLEPESVDTYRKEKTTSDGFPPLPPIMHNASIEAKKRRWKTKAEIRKNLISMRLYVKAYSPLGATESEWRDILIPEYGFGKEFPRLIADSDLEILRRLRKDSVIITGEEGQTEELVVFSPNQIKSADPVTYDADGNVIPLSQRFNPQSDDTRFQPASTQDFTPDRIADTVAGFLPDGITLDGLDLAQLADDVSELDPANAEDYVHAVVNRELAKHVARRTLGEDVPESEITRITDAYELITRGRLEGARMAHFRTNPTALKRLIEFLKEAITSLYGRLTARYDNGTAMLVNRLARELAHAREGFNHDIRTSRGYDPDIRFLPSTTLQSILEAPSAQSGFVTLYDADPSKQATADKAPRKTKVGQWAEKLFVSSQAGVAESMTNAKVRRDATLRAIEVTLKNLAGQVQRAVASEQTDVDTVRTAMGNTDPLITETAAARIENDYKNFIADSEADINRERKEMFPEYRETLDRMLAAADKMRADATTDEQLTKADEARERAYSAAEAAFNRAYDANAELRAESDRFFDESMAAVAEDAEKFRSREIVKETKAETARRKADQLAALNRLSVTSPDTFEAVLNARKFVNDLQREVSRISDDRPEFKAIVDNSLSVYLVRSYRIHQDPKLADKILNPKEPELIAAKEGFIRYLTPIAEDQIFRELERDSEFLKSVDTPGDYEATIAAMRAHARTKAEGRAVALFEDFILGHTESVSPMGGSSVSNELARYMKKANLPEEMQRVLQVNTDPVFNMAYTGMSLARLIVNQKLLTEIRDSGIDSGRFITEAEKVSGVTFAKGRETMRKVFSEEGNGDLKADVKDKLFVTLRAALDSRFNAGVIPDKPDAEQITRRLDEAFAYFAEGGSLATALPEIGASADRIATDHFITSRRLGTAVRDMMLPEPGRFRSYQPVVSPNEGNAAFRPLGGLYASKEDGVAFRASFNTGRKADEDAAHKLLGKMKKIMVGAAGASLAVVTLGNPGYYGRNLLGGMFMASAQGVDFTNIENWKTASRFLGSVVKPNGEITPEFQELIAGRIVYDGAQIDYLRQLLDEAGANPEKGLEDLMLTSHEADTALGKAAKKGKGAYKALVGKLGQFAEASEVMCAVMVYTDFKAKLKEANFGSETEIMQEASRLTKMVMPSKSEASSIVSAFSGSGPGAIMAPFLRFKAEVIRNAVNTPKLAMEWMRSDNPVLQKYGRRKMAAFAGVYGLVTLAMPIIIQRLIMGISDDEDEAIRASLPIYLRNASLYYFKNEEGVRIANASYTNPLSFAMDPLSRTTDALIAAAVNRDASELGEIPAILGRFIAEDFIGENIVAGKVMDARRNKDDNGFPIYLESDTDTMKAYKSAKHIIGGSYYPKVISQGVKLWESTQRNTDEAEFWYQPLGVAAATVAPFRIMPNSYDDIERKAFASKRRQLGELWQITSKIFSPQPISSEEMVRLYEDRVEATDRINAETLKFAKAFTELRGGDERAVEANMVDAGISKKKARLLIGAGATERLVFSKEQMQDALEKHGDEARDLFDHILTSRPRLIPVDEK